MQVGTIATTDSLSDDRHWTLGPGRAQDKSAITLCHESRFGRWEAFFVQQNGECATSADLAAVGRWRLEATMACAAAGSGSSCGVAAGGATGALQSGSLAAARARSGWGRCQLRTASAEGVRSGVRPGAQQQLGAACGRRRPQKRRQNNAGGVSAPCVCLHAAPLGPMLAACLAAGRCKPL